jgi:hypothetical protein
MGHQRLGSPPTSRNLPEIITLLVAGDASDAQLVDAIAKASDVSLKRAIKDSAFIEALWLLIRIPQAAKNTDFREALGTLGITVPNTPSVIEIIVGYDEAIEAAQRGASSGITDLSEMARHAGIAAFDSVVQQRLPALWEPTREDVQTTIATLAGPEKFGELSQRFFSNFVEHIIQYFLDRELPRHIGPENLVHSVGDMTVFDVAVRRHCAEATLIMRAFAKDWLGKKVFKDGKEISRGDVAAFASHASDKIRQELLIRSGLREVV